MFSENKPPRLLMELEELGYYLSSKKLKLPARMIVSPQIDFMHVDPDCVPGDQVSTANNKILRHWVEFTGKEMASRSREEGSGMVCAAKLKFLLRPANKKEVRIDFMRNRHLFKRRIGEYVYAGPPRTRVMECLFGIEWAGGAPEKIEALASAMQKLESTEARRKSADLGYIVLYSAGGKLSMASFSRLGDYYPEKLKTIKKYGIKKEPYRL